MKWPEGCSHKKKKKIQGLKKIFYVILTFNKICGLNFTRILVGIFYFFVFSFVLINIVDPGPFFFFFNLYVFFFSENPCRTVNMVEKFKSKLFVLSKILRQLNQNSKLTIIFKKTVIN